MCAPVLHLSSLPMFQSSLTSGISSVVSTLAGSIAISTVLPSLVRISTSFFQRSNFSCTTLRHTLAWYAAGLGYAAVEGGPQEMELLHERRSRVNTDGIVSTAAARYSLESTHLRCAGRISKEEIKSRSPEHHWAAIVLYRHL